MFKVVLKPQEEKRILDGGLFIFSNEVLNIIGNIESGTICEVYSSTKEFIGQGFFNSASKIIVRMLSRTKDVVTIDLFKQRIIDANNYRKSLNIGNSYRMVFGEADLLPGLVIDKYENYLVVQFLCLGMDRLKKEIVNILIELFNPKGIYERSDTPIRKKEGLEEIKGPIYGEFNEDIIIKENNINLRVDIINGQKTGYFLDQKLNRKMLEIYAKNRDVLDCFSHTGGFALNAANNHARTVTAVDISQKACDDILYNARLNKFSNVTCLCTDVFDYLRKDDIKDKYDLIVLDPPAFTKTKDTIKKAYKGYKEINLQALKKIRRGGIILSFSCSEHMEPALFLQMIKEAIKDSKRIVQMIDFRIQSPDHPIMLESIDSLYLKSVVLHVVE